MQQLLSPEAEAAMKTFRAEFLNVDLDIKSKSDLAVLADAWNRRVLTHADRIGRRYWLHLVLMDQPKSATDAIRRYAKLIRGLSGRARNAWQQATKEFDVGVQAGWERRSGEWVLDAKSVRAVAALGASLRLTVYSPLRIVEGAKKPTRRMKKAKRR